MNLKNKIFLWPALYITAMGLSNLTVHVMFKANYGSPQYVKAMLPFLLIMALGTLLCVYLQRNRLKEEWTDRGHYGLFLLLFSPTFLMTLFFIIKSGSFDRNFLIPFILTLLVGLAEELMFRRILFIGLLKEMHFSKALLLSSLAFSLLHSVNIFAGLPVNEMLIQLLMTFLAGLYFALMYWHTKSIYLMIASHWLWDYVLLSGAVDAFPAFGSVMSALALLQIITAFYLKSKIYKELSAGSR